MQDVRWGHCWAAKHSRILGLGSDISGGGAPSTFRGHQGSMGWQVPPYPPGFAYGQSAGLAAYAPELVSSEISFLTIVNDGVKQMGSDKFTSFKGLFRRNNSKAVSDIV